MTCKHILENIKNFRFKLLQNYLFSTIIGTTLLVFLMFLGLELFVFLMVELTDLSGHYGVWEAFVYVMATLPSRLYFSMPIILLLGSLMGMARLAVTSELVVMLVSGLSKFQVVRIVLLAASVLMVISVVFGEWLGPLGDRYGYEHKSKTFKSRSFQAQQGVWVKSGHDFIFLGWLTEDKKKAYYVVKFHFDQHRILKSASFAHMGVLGDRFWQMRQVRTTLFQNEGGDRLQRSVSEVWPVNVSVRALGKRGGIAYQEPLWRLYESIQTRKEEGINAIQDEFIFWRRLWHPFATLIMIGIAAPFIFGSLRERSISSKIMIGALIALVFYALNIFFGPVAAIFNVSPMLAATMPSMIIILAGIAYMTYRRRRVWLHEK